MKYTVLEVPWDQLQEIVSMNYLGFKPIHFDQVYIAKPNFKTFFWKFQTPQEQFVVVYNNETVFFDIKSCANYNARSGTFSSFEEFLKSRRLLAFQ